MAQAFEPAGQARRQPMNVGAGENNYSAGIYARLSVDSHNEKNESIQSQLEIAKAFLDRQPDMVLFDCYTDLGKTGTNFEREGFDRLMWDVRRGKVNCIIVKDFSRLGRSYIETGGYIQKIFPFLGVRFISVTDQYDSLSGDGNELGVNLKNLANEMYARDIAAKVKSTRRAQREKGGYTGGIPPYGYRAEWVDGIKRLFAEEETCGIVREIYRLFDTGRKMREIAAWLYEKKVHRPKDYRRFGHAFCREGEELREWPSGSVRMILANPVYMGSPAEAEAGGRRRRLCGEDGMASADWSVKENTHEAIVGGELFFRVAERLERQSVYGNRRGDTGTAPGKEDIFAGLLFCGDCGSRLRRVGCVKTLSSGKVRSYGYCCRNSSRMDGLRCEEKYITEQTLTRLVREALRLQFALGGVGLKALAAKTGEAFGERRRRAGERLREAERRMENRRLEAGRQYLNYRGGRMGREAYLGWKEENQKRLGELEKLREEQERLLRELTEAEAGQNRFLRAVVRGDGKAELNREILSALIKRIRLFSGERIEMTFCFGGKNCP